MLSRRDLAPGYDIIIDKERAMAIMGGVFDMGSETDTELDTIQMYTIPVRPSANLSAQLGEVIFTMLKHVTSAGFERWRLGIM